MGAKKHTKKERETAIRLYAFCGSSTEVEKETGINASTVRNWINNLKPSEKEIYEAAKKEASEKFGERADSIIQKGLTLIEKQFNRALEKEIEIDDIINELCDDTNLDEMSKFKLIKGLTELKCINFKDVSTVIGTLYDKKALFEGKSTQNQSFEITVNVVE